MSEILENALSLLKIDKTVEILRQLNLRITAQINA